MVDDVFDRLVEQAACRGLLDSTYRIDSTHVTAIQYNDEATWNYDSTAEEHYYGFGCVIVSAGPKIPIAAEFTQRKQIDAETAMRVTKDALAVDTRSGCSETALTTCWSGTTSCCRRESCRLRRTTRNTDDPLDIEYRVEDRIDEHAEDISLKQSVLAGTYDHRTQVERTNEACKDCGLGHVRARGRVHARTQVFLALCLRVIVAVTNYERGHNPGRTKLKTL